MLTQDPLKRLNAFVSFIARSNQLNAWSWMIQQHGSVSAMGRNCFFSETCGPALGLNMPPG